MTKNHTIATEWRNERFSNHALDDINEQNYYKNPVVDCTSHACVFRQLPIGRDLAISSSPENLIKKSANLLIEVEHKIRWRSEKKVILSHDFLSNLQNEVYYWRQVPTEKVIDSVPEDRALRARNESVLFDHTWIGPPGTVQTFHLDHHINAIMNENLFIQVYGLKYVAIAGPEDSKVFRAKPLVEGNTRHSLVSPFDSSASSECSTLAHCILFPGDALYIPKGYWHYIESITPSISLSRWWFSCPIAETLYSASRRDERVLGADYDRKDFWNQDVDDFGGREKVSEVLDLLPLTEKFASLSWLYNRYSMGVI